MRETGTNGRSNNNTSDVGERQEVIVGVTLTLGCARTRLGRKIVGHKVGGRRSNHVVEPGAKSTSGLCKPKLIVPVYCL